MGFEADDTFLVPNDRCKHVSYNLLTRETLPGITQLYTAFRGLYSSYSNLIRDRFCVQNSGDELFIFLPDVTHKTEMWFVLSLGER